MNPKEDRVQQDLEEGFQILGDMATKIKNNVKQQVQQFSWKLTFPKDIIVGEIPTDGIMILNKNLNKLRTEFAIYPKENSILISPQTPYKPGQEYFFWAKYRNKEICIAFLVTAEKEMQTFDQKTSLDKMNLYYKRQARKAEVKEQPVIIKPEVKAKVADIID